MLTPLPHSLSDSTGLRAPRPGGGRHGRPPQQDVTLGMPCRRVSAGGGAVGKRWHVCPREVLGPAGPWGAWGARGGAPLHGFSASGPCGGGMGTAPAPHGCAPVLSHERGGCSCLLGKLRHGWGQECRCWGGKRGQCWDGDPCVPAVARVVPSRCSSGHGRSLAQPALAQVWGWRMEGLPQGGHGARHGRLEARLVAVHAGRDPCPQPWVTLGKLGVAPAPPKRRLAGALVPLTCRASVSPAESEGWGVHGCWGRARRGGRICAPRAPPALGRWKMGGARMDDVCTGV